MLTHNHLRAELTGSDICTAGDVTARGDAPVLALCRALLAAGFDPATPLHVYRGSMLCLTVSSLAAGARLTVKTAGNGAPIFALEAAPGGAAASLVRPTAPRHQPEQGAVA